MFAVDFLSQVDRARAQRYYPVPNMTTSQVREPPSYRQVAESLAAAHRRVDTGIVKVFLAVDPLEREVRLVEVTTEAPTTMEVLRYVSGRLARFRFLRLCCYLAPRSGPRVSGVKSMSQTVGSASRSSNGGD